MQEQEEARKESREAVERSQVRRKQGGIGRRRKGVKVHVWGEVESGLTSADKPIEERSCQTLYIRKHLGSCQCFRLRFLSRFGKKPCHCTSKVNNEKTQPLRGIKTPFMVMSQIWYEVKKQIWQRGFHRGFSFGQTISAGRNLCNSFLEQL